MKETINHEIYGYITYEESFWTGKCTMQLDGKPMDKIAKKTFFMTKEDGSAVNISVNGSFISGVKLNVNGEEIQIVPAIKWYEIVLSLPIFILILVWGGSVALCNIVPVVGGAIGGAISGALTVVNLIVVKKIKNVWLKILVSIGMMGAAFLICWLIGLAILGAMV